MVHMEVVIYISPYSDRSHVIRTEPADLFKSRAGAYNIKWSRGLGRFKSSSPDKYGGWIMASKNLEEFRNKVKTYHPSAVFRPMEEWPVTQETSYTSRTEERPYSTRDGSPNTYPVVEKWSSARIVEDDPPRPDTTVLYYPALTDKIYAKYGGEIDEFDIVSFALNGSVNIRRKDGICLTMNKMETRIGVYWQIDAYNDKGIYHIIDTK